MWNKVSQKLRRTQLYARSIYTLLRKPPKRLPKADDNFEYDTRIGWHIMSILINASIIATVTLKDQSHCDKEVDEATGVDFEMHHTVTNWSGNHICHAHRLYEPRSAQEVLRLLQTTHRHNKTHPENLIRIRPIGTGLSPNGIGMHSTKFTNDKATQKEQINLVSTAALDYIEVDTKKQLVTVGAGVKVCDLLKALDQHNLTLQNFSSITEQTIAGWTQVAAHGTGIGFSTVDDMIVRMQLATATEGLLTLSKELNGELFRMAKVGLGSLGIVTELTLKCVPKHQLREYVYTFPTLKEMKKEHYERLSTYRHVKYLLFPYTSGVITIAAHPPHAIPVAEDRLYQQIQQQTQLQQQTQQQERARAAATSHAYFPWEHHPQVATLPTRALLRLLYQTDAKLFETKGQLTSEIPNICTYSYTQLRDLLLSYAPLNVNLLKSIAQAEVNYWEQEVSCTKHVADSNAILGFDCGGRQLVYEVCFPIGTIEDVKQNETDVNFLQSLLQCIHTNFIPAHCPIEVRYTAANTKSPMSPAYSSNPHDLFCWVGIIMYLPTSPDGPDADTKQHAEIQDMFAKYRMKLQPLLSSYKAVAHWAKIDYQVSPEDVDEMQQNKRNAVAEESQNSSSKSSSKSGWGWLFGGEGKSGEGAKTDIQYVRESLQQRYPLRAYNNYRLILDPTGILSTPFIQTLFQLPPPSSSPSSSITTITKK